MNKIMKRHSDGSVTTFGEALTAVTKGALVGVGIGTVTVLTGLGAAYLSVELKKNHN